MRGPFPRRVWLQSAPPKPDHRLVVTQEFGAVAHYCLDCGASRRGIHPPPPPCKGDQT